MHDTFVATREYLSNMAKRNDANLMMLNKENLTRQYVDRYIPARFYEKFNLMETDNMELLIEFAKQASVSAVSSRNLLKTNWVTDC